MRLVRAEEAVVRYGGDEFLVVLESADEARAAMVAERLQVAALRTAPVPFSLGWAARKPEESFEQVLHRANQGLMAVRVIDRASERAPARTPPTP
jgi:diguanylate cyclase (GGDEF)-like protein